MADEARFLRALMRGYSCGHGCIFGSPSGMATNGACKHTRRDVHGVSAIIKFIREAHEVLEPGDA